MASILSQFDNENKLVRVLVTLEQFLREDSRALRSSAAHKRSSTLRWLAELIGRDFDEDHSSDHICS